MSVDVPLISLPTLKALLQLHMGGGYDATILSHDGNIEPLIAVYNTNIAGLAGELISNKKGRRPKNHFLVRQPHRNRNRH